MYTMQERLCRPDNRVVYCIAIAVDPDLQSQGVGSSMISHAVSLAEQCDAGMWVHLADSAKGVRAFERNGFRLVSGCEVELDEYRRRVLLAGQERWGTYTFRCMVKE
jgi:GNAT superfamily N-acetyltransferase